MALGLFLIPVGRMMGYKLNERKRNDLQRNRRELSLELD